MRIGPPVLGSISISANSNGISTLFFHRGLDTGRKRSFFPPLFQFPVDLAERDGVYFCFSGNGHEVGVSFPAGYQVQVDMSGNSCASNAPKVDPEVIPIRLESSIHGGLCIPGGRHQFERFFRGQFFTYNPIINKILKIFSKKRKFELSRRRTWQCVRKYHQLYLLPVEMN